MRRVLAEWQRSGLRLREFGEQRGLPLSTLRWWRRVLRAAETEVRHGVAAEPAVEFSEVPAPVSVPRNRPVVLASGHLLRIAPGVDRATLEQVLGALQTRC